jgi:hypothetical protein
MANIEPLYPSKKSNIRNVSTDLVIPHINFNDFAAGGSRSLLCGQSDYKHEELANLEDETTTLPRNVGNKVISDVASYPSRTETSG